MRKYEFKDDNCHMSFKDVGEALGISGASAYKIYSKAMAKIKRIAGDREDLREALVFLEMIENDDDPVLNLKTF